MMLRTKNAAGSHIYPQYKTGEIDGAHDDKHALTVFVPDGGLGKGDWACTIEGEHGAVILKSPQELYHLITALEIAFEKVRVKDGLM